MNLSMVIPVYRDTATLDELCRRIFSATNQLHLSCELILVESSTDPDEWKKLQKLKECLQGKPLILVRLCRTVGQHYALWLGLLQARGDFLMTMDADLQHIPEAIPDLLKKLEEKNADLIYGYGAEGHAKAKQVSSWLFRLLTFPVNQPAAIYANGFRLFKKEVFHKACCDHPLFASIDTPLLNAAKSITALTVPHQQRPRGQSHYTTVDRWLLALRFVLLNDATFKKSIALSLFLLSFFIFTASSFGSYLHTLLALFFLALAVSLFKIYRRERETMCQLFATSIERVER